MRLAQRDDPAEALLLDQRTNRSRCSSPNAPGHQRREHEQQPSWTRALVLRLHPPIVPATGKIDAGDLAATRWNLVRFASATSGTLRHALRRPRERSEFRSRKQTSRRDREHGILGHLEASSQNCPWPRRLNSLQSLDRRTGCGGNQPDRQRPRPIVRNPRGLQLEEGRSSAQVLGHPLRRVRPQRHHTVQTPRGRTRAQAPPGLGT